MIVTLCLCPLVLSEADVDRAMSYPGPDIVGFEIIFTDLKQSHISEDFLNALKREGYFVGKRHYLRQGILPECWNRR